MHPKQKQTPSLHNRLFLLLTASMALLAGLLCSTDTASAQTTLMFKYPMDAAHSSATATTNDLTVGAALNTPIPLLTLGTTKNQPTDRGFVDGSGNPLAGYYYADLRGGPNSGVQGMAESLNFTNVVNPGAFAPYTLMAVGVSNTAVASMGDGITPGSTFSSFVGTCWINMTAPTVGAADGQGPVLWMMGINGAQAPGTANTICFRFNSRPGTIGNPAQSCNAISNTFEVRISNAASVEAPIYFPQTTNMWMFFGVIYNSTNQNGYIYYGTEGSPVKLMGIKNIGPVTLNFGATASLYAGNIINTWVRHFDGKIADWQFYTGAPGGDVANQAFLEAIRQQRTPVVITNLYPDGMGLMQGTNTLTFTATSASGINPSNIHVTVNGTDVSRSLVVGGTSTARTVSYTGLPVNQFLAPNPAGAGFAPNLNAVNMTLSVTDSNGITANNVYTYDDFSPTNYTWEAEDYDFTNGLFIDNPVYSFTNAANAYFSLNGTSSVDYSTVNSTATFYRTGDTVGTEKSLSSTTDNGNQNNGNMGELMRSKVLAGVDLNASGLEDIREADVTGFMSGNWMNYTRTYPTGYFNVYLRGASFRGVQSVVGSGVSATLSSVTSGWGTSLQTSNVLGTFSVTNTGGSEDYAWIPLVNGGTNAIIQLGGTNTLNLASGTNNGTGSQAFNLNFLMLVERPVPGFLLQPTNTTTTAGFSATFNSQVFATNTITYQWQRSNPGVTNFVSIPHATNASYTTPLLSIGPDNQAQYWVLATSGGITITSVVAVVTVTPSIPPVLLGAFDDFQGITVAFSQPVDPVSGANTAHYALNGGASVTGASVSGNSVLLTPSGLTFGQNYTLVVNNVSNNFGGVVAANSTTSFGAYTFFDNFNGGAFPVVPAYASVYGSAVTFSTGGTTNTGRLQFTGAPNQAGSVVFPDALSGGNLNSFQAAFYLQFAFPSSPPGDNFSFNLANDVTSGTFSGATGTGLSVVIALSGNISVLYNGTVAQNSVDNSLLTQPIDTSSTGLSDGVFRQVIIKVAADGSLNLVIGGVGYFSGAVIAGWQGTGLTAPKLGIGGACGGNSVQMSIDDLQVVYNGSLPLPLPPTIVITSPANGASVAAGSTVPVTVNAVPSGNAITRVEYFVNGTEVFTNTVAPYSFSPGLVNVGNQVYNIAAKVTDTAGRSSTSTTVQIVAGNPQQVLFVTGNPPTVSDNAFMNYLNNLGFQVVQEADFNASAGDAGGKVLVVISSTVVSANVDPAFATVAVPLLLWEPALEGQLLFDAAGNNVASSSQITIVNPSSPLAAGLSGTVTVLSSANTIGWGNPTNAIGVGVIPGSTTNYCLYAYETGSLLYDGVTPAPARRVFTFLYDNSYPSITPAGQQLINASVFWLLGINNGPPVLTSGVSGNTLTLTWTAGATLQETTNLTGIWTDLSTSGTLSTNMNQPTQFYRVKQ